MATERHSTAGLAGRARPEGGRRRPMAPPVVELEQYLTFRIGTERYAVAVLEASEVLEYRAPTPVPRAPVWVAGMLNLRGKAIPVLDLAVKFGAPAQEPSATACIVVLDLVLDDEASLVGLIADEVPVVVQLAPDQIAEPPLFGTLVHVRFLRGMARVEGGLMLVLDAAGALTAQDAALLSRLDEEANNPSAPQLGGSEPEASGSNPRANDS